MPASLFALLLPVVAALPSREHEHYKVPADALVLATYTSGGLMSNDHEHVKQLTHQRGRAYNSTVYQLSVTQEARALDVLSNLGACVKNLPGKLSEPKYLLKEGKKALKKGTYKEFLTDNILNPIAEEAADQFHGGVENVKDFFSDYFLHLVTPEGDIDPTNIQKLSDGSFDLITKQVELNPTLNCLVEVANFKGKLKEKLGPTFVKMLNFLLEKLKAAWSALKNNLADGFLSETFLGTALEKIKAGMKKFDVIANDAINAMCVVRVGDMIELANSPKTFTADQALCSPDNGALTKGLEDPQKYLTMLLETLFTSIGPDLINALMEHVVYPLEKMLFALVTTVVSAVFQAIEAAMGLVPEFGAAIGAAVGVPLSSVMTKVIDAITTGFIGVLVQELKDGMEQKLPEYAEKGATFLVDKLAETGVFTTIENIEEAIEEALTEANEATAGAQATIATIVTKFLKPAQPFLKMALKNALPQLNTGWEACTASMAGLYEIVAISKCGQLAGAEKGKNPFGTPGTGPAGTATSTGPTAAETKLLTDEVAEVKDEVAEVKQEMETLRGDVMKAIKDVEDGVPTGPQPAADPPKGEGESKFKNFIKKINPFDEE